MNQEDHKFRAALESQLENLRDRLAHPDASQWRKMGKWALDFELWLERAKPCIPCASRLISIRVEQIVRDYAPGSRSEAALRKFLDLLDEARRQLQKPGEAIQVLDLEKDKVEEPEGELRATDTPGLFQEYAGTQLPQGLVEIPEYLQPKGDPPVHFRYLIPN